MANKKLIGLLLLLTTAYSYLIFPVEYLPEERYLFYSENQNQNEESKEDMMRRIYYRNMMTTVEIGTPPRNVTMILDSDDDRHFFASNKRPKISNEPYHKPEYYKFDLDELLNETESSTYKKGPCEAVDYKVFKYAEICTSKDNIVFHHKGQTSDKIFEFKLVRNNADNIPGLIGLLYNYKNTNTKFPNFINELRAQNLIDNNYWFFNFDKVAPFNRILQGQLVIGALPHDIFPDKFKKSNFVDIKKARRAHFHGSWKIEFDKIFIDDKDYEFLLYNTVCTLNYEMYPIIGSLEFHFRIKEKFLDDMLEEKKCFKGTFHQNVVFNNDLTFYYCNITEKDFLYKTIPNIKFYSEEFNQMFELTKEELFYEHGDYIYFMILFGGITFNYFSLGQMFTTKFNFVFNTFYQEIGFYKTENSKGIMEKKIKSNEMPYLYIVLVLIPFISLFVGLLIGKTVFGKRPKKQIANELIDEKDSSLNKV